MSETARLIRESTDRFLDRHLGMPGGEAGDGFAKALNESGLAEAFIPSNTVTGSTAWSDAAEIAIAWGRHAAPLPIVEMLVAAPLVSAGLPLGDHAVVGMISTTDCNKEQRLDAAGPPGVTHLVAVLIDEAAQCFRLAAIKVSCVDSWTTLHGERRFKMDRNVLDGKNVIDCGFASFDAASAGVLFTTASMVGAMEAVLETICDYARTRKQFGRPLAKLQGIQFMIAETASELAVTSAALASAFRRADEGILREFDVAAVKAQAGRAAGTVAANAHQVMGAIGFTEEHTLHQYTKRLWTWRDSWMRQSTAEEIVGREACSAGRDGLWPLISG